jgi:hypothetical protein
MVLGGFSFYWTLEVRVRWHKQWGSSSTQLVHMIMLVCEISLHILPYASLPKLKGMICVKNGSNDTTIAKFQHERLNLW